ncbi:ribonucleotide reductase [Ephemerocybe angulata]|uniref:Ribonucleoside-diphosphate reductase n=1 Tax=Ephemerocybe angulata TaxID=980116 RepID=A0A8H6M5X9_9AGAR|nr:ribonucleotide reductase [Tulosesus angulatus]
MNPSPEPPQFPVEHEHTCYVRHRDLRIEDYDHNKVLTRLYQIVGVDDITEDAEEAIANLARILKTRLGHSVLSKDIEPMIVSIAESVDSADPIYSTISTTLLLEAIYKETDRSFYQAMNRAHLLGLLSAPYKDLIERHRYELDSIIVESRDNLFSSTALAALRDKYLIRHQGGILERPQHMFLRTALQAHGDDIDSVKLVYGLMSTHKILPGSPILINSGTPSPGLASSYMLPVDPDPRGLLDNLAKVYELTRIDGGVGLGMGSIPARGSIVDNVVTSGLLSNAKAFDSCIPIMDQGRSQRPAAVTTFIEVWHADVFSYVSMKRPDGQDSEITKNMFTCLWINDLFMKRVNNDELWTLFSPSDAPNLISSHGEDFQHEYRRLEAAGLGKTFIKARALWKTIIQMILTTGGPSIMFKDAVNGKTNHSHLGTITQSGPCLENAQYCDDQETAVTVLASLVLPNFITYDGLYEPDFDYDDLESSSRQLVRTMNKVYGEAYFPVPSVRASAYSHRAIGIGIQGLADTFAMLSVPFDSPAARVINHKIAETIYYAATDESCNLIGAYGPHPSFNKSPAALGWFQHDMWDDSKVTPRYDWEELRIKIRKGITNSLLTAYMPTAGTSQLSGYTEGFEPFPSLCVTKDVRSIGRVMTFSKHLTGKLDELGLWDDEMRRDIVDHGGSIQGIHEIPLEIRDTYRTCWEIDPHSPIKLAAERGPFVCQSQSMSLYMSPPSLNALSRQLIHAWWAGLKTGLYCLVTRPAGGSVVIVDPDLTTLTYDNPPLAHADQRVHSDEELESEACHPGGNVIVSEDDDE